MVASLRKRHPLLRLLQHPGTPGADFVAHLEYGMDPRLKKAERGIESLVA